MRLLYILFLIISFICKSQEIQCDTVSKKNIKYVTFEIKSKDLYPVKMSGLFENYNAKDFSYTNADTFVKSFFEKGIYTPFIDGGYKEMLYVFCDSTVLNSIIEKNKKKLSDIIITIENEHPEIFEFKTTNDKVYIKSIDINGTFLEVDKNRKGVSTNTLEWDILSIEEIKKVLIPFDNLELTLNEKCKY